MTPPDPPPADPADDALDRALRAWAAPELPDDGFTTAVLQRVAQARTPAGITPADALQRLRARQQRQARQLRRSGWGLGLGVVVAMAWLLAGGAGAGAGADGPAGSAVPWLLWLGAALAGLGGSVAWLLQQAD